VQPRSAGFFFKGPRIKISVIVLTKWPR